MLYFHYDWKRHRPPYQKYDTRLYRDVFYLFSQDVKEGNWLSAYEQLSPQLKNQMSPAQFYAVLRSHPALRLGAIGRRWSLDFTYQAPKGEDAVPLKNWATFQSEIVLGGQHFELWVWVVMEDSIMCRRPPWPHIGDFQVRKVPVSLAEREMLPPLSPRWEQR
jgi:hypothetical protein